MLPPIMRNKFQDSFKRVINKLIREVELSTGTLALGLAIKQIRENFCNFSALCADFKISRIRRIRWIFLLTRCILLVFLKSKDSFDLVLMVSKIV